jgi:accessory gene regulator protein AgrB
MRKSGKKKVFCEYLILESITMSQKSDLPISVSVISQFESFLPILFDNEKKREKSFSAKHKMRKCIG